MAKIVSLNEILNEASLVCKKTDSGLYIGTEAESGGLETAALVNSHELLDLISSYPEGSHMRPAITEALHILEADKQSLPNEWVVSDQKALREFNL